MSLPKEYSDISNELTTISNDNSGLIFGGKTNLSQEYLARLQLLELYLRMQVYLYEKDLSISNHTSSNTEWFNEVNNFLTNTYDEYENRVGE